MKFLLYTSTLQLKATLAEHTACEIINTGRGKWETANYERAGRVQQYVIGRDMKYYIRSWGVETVLHIWDGDIIMIRS